MYLEEFSNVDVRLENGDWDCKNVVEWTPELQEAWDKQQELKVRNPFGYESSSTLNPIPSGYCNDCGQMLHKDKHNYCPSCGQKIKW